MYDFFPLNIYIYFKEVAVLKKNVCLTHSQRIDIKQYNSISVLFSTQYSSLYGGTIRHGLIRVHTSRWFLVCNKEIENKYLLPQKQEKMGGARTRDGEFYRMVPKRQEERTTSNKMVDPIKI